jgi:hypothetical protein
MTQQLSLTTLPDQPSYRLIDYLEVKDLARLCQTCKRLAALVRDAAVWVNRPCVDLSGQGSQRGPWLDSHHVFQCLSGTSAPTEHPLATLDGHWNRFIASTKLNYFALLTKEGRDQRTTRVRFLDGNYKPAFNFACPTIGADHSLALVDDIDPSYLALTWWKPGAPEAGVIWQDSRGARTHRIFGIVKAAGIEDQIQMPLHGTRHSALAFLVTNSFGSLKLSPIPAGELKINKKEEIAIKLPSHLEYRTVLTAPPIDTVHLPPLGTLVIRCYQEKPEATK